MTRGGIEPPTRGFSVTNCFPQHQLHQTVSWGARCDECPTVQDRAGLTPAKLPQKDHGLPDLRGSTGSNRGRVFRLESARSCCPESQTPALGRGSKANLLSGLRQILAPTSHVGSESKPIQEHQRPSAKCAATATATVAVPSPSPSPLSMSSLTISVTASLAASTAPPVGVDSVNEKLCSASNSASSMRLIVMTRLLVSPSSRLKVPDAS